MICRLFYNSALVFLLTVHVYSVLADGAVYQLSNANFTRYLNAENTSNGSYRLIEDVFLTDVQVPIGSRSRPLSLKFDGDGHAVSGLNLTTDASDTPTGLFGYLVDSRVHHLLLVRPNVVSHGHRSPAGAVVGEMVRSSVTETVSYMGNVQTTGDKFIFHHRLHSSAGGTVGLARNNSRVDNNQVSSDVNTEGEDAHVGGVLGYAGSGCAVTGNLATGNVSTKGRRANGGGVVGYVSDGSSVTGNVATGRVDTAGYFSYAGGVVGYVSNGSSVAGNLAIANVDTQKWNAYAGGVVGCAQVWSTVSGNLAVGNVATKGEFASVGGVVGYVRNESRVSENAALCNVNTKGNHADAGGVAGEVYSSRVMDNLAVGNTSTGGVDAFAGGVVGYSIHNSPVTGNLAVGNVATEGQNADDGGVVGVASYSPVAANLAVCSVGAEGVSADAGGVVGYSRYNSIVSGNFAAGEVFELGGTPDQPGYPYARVEESRIRNSSNGLNETLWNFGTDEQFPIPVAINPAYQDMARINGTQGGKNIFPEILSTFASPGKTSASLFDQNVWKVESGQLPVLQSFDQQLKCPVLFRLHGSLERLVYDGQRYQGFVGTVDGRALWIEYADESRVSIQPCGVSNLVDWGLSRVDAAVFNDNRLFLVGPSVQAESARLVTLTLSERPLQPVSPQLNLESRAVSLAIDGDDLLVGTSRAVYRLSKNDNTLVVGWDGEQVLNSAEVIQWAVGGSGDLYLLTHELEIGYRVKQVSASGSILSVSVVTPSETDVRRQAITFLRLDENRLHLLMIDSGSVIWWQYRLGALNAWERRIHSGIPRSLTVLAVILAEERNTDSGSVMDPVAVVLGQDSENQPQYLRLMVTDFNEFFAEGGSDSNALPRWAQAVLGTGVTLTVSALLGGLGVLARKAYVHYYPEAENDAVGRLYERLKTYSRRGVYTIRGQRDDRHSGMCNVVGTKLLRPRQILGSELGILDLSVDLAGACDLPHKQGLAAVAHPYEQSVPQKPHMQKAAVGSQAHEQPPTNKTNTVEHVYDEIQPAKVERHYENIVPTGGEPSAVGTDGMPPEQHNLGPSDPPIQQAKENHTS